MYTHTPVTNCEHKKKSLQNDITGCSVAFPGVQPQHDAVPRFTAIAGSAFNYSVNVNMKHMYTHAHTHVPTCIMTYEFSTFEYIINSLYPKNCRYLRPPPVRSFSMVKPWQTMREARFFFSLFNGSIVEVVMVGWLRYHRF